MIAIGSTSNAEAEATLASVQEASDIIIANGNAFFGRIPNDNEARGMCFMWGEHTVWNPRQTG